MRSVIPTLFDQADKVHPFSPLIDISQNDSTIILSISDKAIGIEVKKNGKGIGLANIKSRPEFYKWSAYFASQPGKSCVLTVSFPVGDSLS